MARTERSTAARTAVARLLKTLTSAAALVGLAILLPACGSLRNEIATLNGEPPIDQAPPQKHLDQPVQHVFVIFKENHTYDNYFLAYPNPTAPHPSPT